MKKNEQRTFKNVLHHSILHYGDNIAVSMVGGKPISYEKFGNKVEIISKILQKRGIAKADKVAILSENKPQWGIAYFCDHDTWGDSRSNPS